MDKHLKLIESRYWNHMMISKTRCTDCFRHITIGLQSMVVKRSMHFLACTTLTINYFSSDMLRSVVCLSTNLMRLEQLNCSLDRSPLWLTQIQLVCIFRSIAAMLDLKQSTFLRWVRFMHHPSLGMFSNIFTFINDFSLAINIFRKINISPLRWICITPLLQAPESIS